MPRPLAHPKSEDIRIAAVLHALADPTRAAIVRELLRMPRGANCTQVAEKLEIGTPKSTFSHHYRILREAGILACERQGTELTSRVRSAELEARFPGLLQSILKAYGREAREP